MTTTSNTSSAIDYPPIRVWGSAAICALVGASTLPPVVRDLAAQRLELSLRADSTEVPVVGAIVRLLGADGVVFTGLTDAAGRLAIQAPYSGSYRIKIDRIGQSGVVTDPLYIGAGDVLRKVISVDSRPFRLPPIEVRSTSRCEVPGPHGEIVGALWEEVQKALTANVITAMHGLPLRVRGFVRELDREGRYLREWVASSGISREAPFRSLAPGELSRRGFVFNVADTAVFAAPDAALLLSDEFVSTHCFFARMGDGGLAGLEFRPLRTRQVPDVTGVLWLDQFTSQLRYLEFSYTGLPGALHRADLGGRIEFARLPEGRWIVNSWYVRMPRLAPPGHDARLAGYVENGGRAEISTDPVEIDHRSILIGQLFDSTVGRGLGGARAWLRGTTDTVSTDSAGRFRFAVHLSGPQMVNVAHPKAGLLGEATSREVVLSLDDTAFVQFTVPSVASFARRYCPRANQRGRVSIVGTARMADGSAAAGVAVDATKRVAGNELPIAGMPTSSVNKVGEFVLCNIPRYDTVSVVLRRGKRTLTNVPVVLEGESRWIDVIVPERIP